MDCIIPGNAVRSFCAAMGCLSRIGKDLLIDFDPIDGLTLRALSDSKSVFASFQYEPSFFDRCSSSLKHLRRKKQRFENGSRDNEHQSLDGNSDEILGRWCVRIAIKSLAAVVRPRKHVMHLQMRTTGDGNFLAFEFCLQRPEGNVSRVVHKVGVATAHNVAAVASMECASELIVHPSVLLTMLEPLKRSAEVALIIDEKHKIISSVSFTQDDVIQENSSALSLLTKKSSLKTEATITYDDLIEVYYVSQVNLPQNDPLPPPNDLQDQAILVFTMKEFRAMLQFCAQANMDHELPATIQFHWGGKPALISVRSQGFSVELLMATLDHKLLGNLKGHNAALS